jgi:hypothetical protein
LQVSAASLALIFSTRSNRSFRSCCWCKHQMRSLSADSSCVGRSQICPETYEFGSQDFIAESRLNSLSWTNSRLFLGIRAPPIMVQPLPRSLIPGTHMHGSATSLIHLLWWPHSLASRGLPSPTIRDYRIHQACLYFALAIPSVHDRLFPYWEPLYCSLTGTK